MHSASAFAHANLQLPSSRIVITYRYYLILLLTAQGYLLFFVRGCSWIVEGCCWNCQDKCSLSVC